MSLPKLMILPQVRLWAALGAAAVIATLVALLAVERAGRRADRAAWQAERVAIAAAADRLSAAALRRVDAAEAAARSRAADAQPILDQARKDTDAFALTPAGREPGLPAARVQSIDELDAALFPAARPAGRGAGAVRADPGAAPARR